MATQPWSQNKTKVECKCKNMIFSIKGMYCQNKTKVECKSFINVFIARPRLPGQNKTKVECKCEKEDYRAVQDWRQNKTKVECKYQKNQNRSHSYLCQNKTKVECKQDYLDQYACKCGVRIKPKWNVNISNFPLAKSHLSLE